MVTTVHGQCNGDVCVCTYCSCGKTVGKISFQILRKIGRETPGHLGRQPHCNTSDTNLSKLVRVLGLEKRMKVFAYFVTMS